MKLRMLTISLISTIIIASCASAVVEEAQAVPAVEEEEAPAVEDSDAIVEEADASEAMEEESAVDSAEAKEVSFSADIWPIIEAEALSAHGGEGGIFLESYDDILQYVVPGKPEESQLYQALTADGHLLMPPDGPLPDEQIQLFFDWISQGAKDN